jgi:hypothetical protein
MRTTVRVHDDLLRAAKAAAASSGRTLTAFIEDALRQALSKKPVSSRKKRVRLTTFKGTGLRPGVDLDDSAALLTAMEE